MLNHIKQASLSAIRAIKRRCRQHTCLRGANKLPSAELEAVALELAQVIVQHGVLADELVQVGSAADAALQRHEDAAVVLREADLELDAIGLEAQAIRERYIDTANALYDDSDRADELAAELSAASEEATAADRELADAIDEEEELDGDILEAMNDRDEVERGLEANHKVLAELQLEAKIKHLEYEAITNGEYAHTLRLRILELTLNKNPANAASSRRAGKYAANY
ncbi:hypothetical protein LPJ70_006924 [Coemansia sp. RSA 2708]|nr:hypothetical protein LPJ70_006924 [Coemansia sp. RSA 2708]